MSNAAHKLAQLPLLCHGGRWLMRFRGKRAEFKDRASALRAAVAEAFEASRNGTPTQVVCIDEHLAIEIAWTYGVDPDPPAALAQQAARAVLPPPGETQRRPHRTPRDVRPMSHG